MLKGITGSQTTGRRTMWQRGQGRIQTTTDQERRERIQSLKKKITMVRLQSLHINKRTLRCNAKGNHCNSSRVKAWRILLAGKPGTPPPNHPNSSPQRGRLAMQPVPRWRTANLNKRVCSSCAEVRQFPRAANARCSSLACS